MSIIIGISSFMLGSALFGTILYKSYFIIKRAEKQLQYVQYTRNPDERAMFLNNEIWFGYKMCFGGMLFFWAVQSLVTTISHLSLDL